MGLTDKIPKFQVCGETVFLFVDDIEHDSFYTRLDNFQIAPDNYTFHADDTIYQVGIPPIIFNDPIKTSYTKQLYILVSYKYDSAQVRFFQYTKTKYEKFVTFYGTQEFLENLPREKQLIYFKYFADQL